MTCIFVDHGLLRKDEAKKVMALFKDNLGVKVIHVNATEKFMGDLKGINDPEQKRKIIGKILLRSFKRKQQKLKMLNG